MFCTYYMYVLNICFQTMSLIVSAYPANVKQRNVFWKVQNVLIFISMLKWCFQSINQYYTVLIYLFCNVVWFITFNHSGVWCDIFSVETSRLNLTEQLPAKVTVTWTTRKWKTGFCWRGRDWVCLMVGSCLKLSTTRHTKKLSKYLVNSCLTRSDGLNWQFNRHGNAMAGPIFQVSPKLWGCVLT